MDGIDGRARDERQVGEGNAFLCLERVLLSSTDPVDLLVVDLDDDQRVSRRRLRADHVLGRDLADPRERNDLVALTRSYRCRRRRRTRLLRWSRLRLRSRLGGRCRGRGRRRRLRRGCRRLATASTTIAATATLAVDVR